MLSDDLDYPAVWGFRNIEIDDKSADVEGGAGAGQLLSDDLVYPAVWDIRNIKTGFYGHSPSSADSRRAVVSYWRKNVH